MLLFRFNFSLPILGLLETREDIVTLSIFYIVLQKNVFNLSVISASTVTILKSSNVRSIHLEPFFTSGGSTVEGRFVLSASFVSRQSTSRTVSLARSFVR